MTPGQHFIISWVISNSADLDTRGRRGITLAWLLPDLDGLGYLVDKVNLQFDVYTSYYADYHHFVGHNIFAGLFIAGFMAGICQRQVLVFCLSLLTFHLHLLADLAGSMGGDGYQWPVYYLYPLMPDLAVTWAGQWELSSWKNSAIGVGFFVLAVVIARYKHITFFEFFSLKLEKTVVAVAWKRGFFKP